MLGKKVISIRFHMDNKEDMELYERLEQEAGTSASLASVVKAKIRDSYNRQDSKEKNNSLQDRLAAAVREEIQESVMRLGGAILSSMGANNGTNLTVVPISVAEKDNLPEKSEELPIGALDFLE